MLAQVRIVSANLANSRQTVSRSQNRVRPHANSRVGARSLITSRTITYQSSLKNNKSPIISTTIQTLNVQSKTAFIRNFADLPSHTKVGLPALSPTMETGNLGKWRKKEGDLIKPGDIIAEVETDKATVDFEATDEGYLAKILVPEGTKDIPVGQPIGITVENKEDIAAFANYKEEGGAAAAPKKEEKAPEAPKAPAAAPTPQPQVQKPVQPQHKVVPGAPPPPSGVPPKSGVFASPLAKAVSTQEGVNLAAVQGTGPSGRILAADVAESAQAPKQATYAVPSGVLGEAYVDIPNSNIRKVTAQRLTLSKQTIPHYYLTMDCRVDELLKLRTKLNEKANGAYKLSVNDFVVKASALACRKVPAVNSSWNGDSIRKYNYVDINVAVNTEKGLFTPIVKDADKLGLAGIANSVKELAEKAKANKLQPHEYSGGTFTISNLGMFGIKTFAAVINPPQSCILAIGGSEKRVIVDENATDKANPYTTANYMSVTLSCDHRVVDGAIGAEWLKAFKEYIEEPVKMLL